MNEQLEALLRQISALEARVSAMESRPNTQMAMRDSLRCPACRGEKILFIDRIEVVPGASEKYTGYARVASEVGWGVKQFGLFQAYICEACGYGELQLDDPALIAERPHVKRLSPPPNEEPYR